MTLFFISDTHFSHENMVSKFLRPDGKTFMRPEFKNATEMDETMIERWNARVRPSDHVYHLGDVAMARPALEAIVPRLNGHLRLVRGNHDIFSTATYLRLGFKEIYGCRVLDNLLFTHIPVAPWSFGRFRANVHGHVHVQAPRTYKKVDPTVEGFCPTWQYVNLCVEQINYTPVSLEELKTWIP